MTATNADQNEAGTDDLNTYLQALAGRRPSLIDLSLERINVVLDRLGQPQKRLPPAFHIAGTNGKGSTGAFIRTILEAAGNRVHAYTSPHLVRYTERISLANGDITPDDLKAALMAVDRAADDASLSFFETFTAAAFLTFAETPADFTILEVGLGGRFDATNVIDLPAASVITPIGLDHQEFLGPSLDRIAMEKGGILKAGVPAVIGRQDPAAMAALERCLSDTGAVPFIFGHQWDSWRENGRLIFQDDAGLSDLGPPRLAGAHQFDNAGLAVAAIKAAGIRVDDAILSSGLHNATWPARLQLIRGGALYRLLVTSDDPSPELWLDGGHNPHAATVIAAMMGDAEERSSKPLVLIVGMQANKDADAFLSVFSDSARAVVGVTSDHNGALDARDIQTIAHKNGIDAFAEPTLSDAMKKARTITQGPARFLICGSLYLAGAFLRQNDGS